MTAAKHSSPLIVASPVPIRNPVRRPVRRVIMDAIQAEKPLDYSRLLRRLESAGNGNADVYVISTQSLPTHPGE